MKFLPNSADIPNDLIRSVSDGDVIFLCGAGVSLGVGLPTFHRLSVPLFAQVIDLTELTFATNGRSRLL
jgi:NAD-dependent SIR2 family protein deacetylase